jgi:hypothetical protein
LRERKTNILLTAVRVRGRGWKSELESGAISAGAVADGTPSGVLPLKIVSQCRVQAGKVYNVAAFEIEQEIPIQIGLVLMGRRWNCRSAPGPGGSYIARSAAR